MSSALSDPLSGTATESVTAPVAGFGQFGLAPVLRKAVSAAGFTEPRPIQVSAIPAVLEGRDVLGLAQTGTGKTAAFALPLLHHLLQTKKRSGPRILVVAPTRELALQIESDFRKLSQGTQIGSVAVFGGVSERPQITLLRRRPQIVVACPGRLLDLAGRNLVQLDRIESLVLDEADHMFDMGFFPDIRRIIALLPEERQNLMFSATMPTEIRQLADTVLRDPVVFQLTQSKPAETIEHSLIPVPDGRKLDLLQNVLDEDGVFSAIVFTRTKRRAHRLARQLTKGGHRAVSLQGDMSQGARERALKGFRSHHFDVLVATDIVARGIDVEAVSHVINFDIPGTPEAYTHRIGRTGRAEREGCAYTLVTEEDRTMIRSIELMLGKPIPRRVMRGFEGVDLPAPSLAALQDEIERRARADRGGRQGGSGAKGSGRGRGDGRSRASGNVPPWERPRGGKRGGGQHGGSRGGAPGARREGDGHRESSRGARREGDGHRESPRGARREGDGHRESPRGARREGDGHREGQQGPRRGGFRDRQRGGKPGGRVQDEPRGASRGERRGDSAARPSGGSSDGSSRGGGGRPSRGGPPQGSGRPRQSNGEGRSESGSGNGGASGHKGPRSGGKKRRRRSNSKGSGRDD